MFMTTATLPRLTSARKNARRPTNVSLDASLIAEARELGVNVSRACEIGLVAELKAARVLRWQEENADAIAGWNEWVRINGLPLAKYRQF